MTRSAMKQGFTLVEAVISTMLLVLVIAGSYSLVNASSKMIYAARNHYVAINIARARLERARDFAYTQLSSLAETNVVVDDSGNPSSSGYFRRSTLVNTNYQTGLTKVEVRSDIRDSRSLNFTTENESVASLFTEYLTQ